MSSHSKCVAETIAKRKRCRSGFAGSHGYDFIIPQEPFNMILAVLCSWGVRLDMNLIPVGWNATHRARNLA